MLQYRLTPVERDEFVEQVKAAEVVEESHSAFAVPDFLVKKPGNQWRRVVIKNFMRM